MNTQRKAQAKQKDLVEYLSSIGMKPSRGGSIRKYYNSPFRSENVPSFCVNTDSNTWIDYGIAGARGALRGDIIDLVMKTESLSFSQAIDHILGTEVSAFVKPDNIEKPNGIDIIDVRPLKNESLLKYADSRSIPRDLLVMYCDEVEFAYSNNELVTHIAIGFKNDKGGYELRNPKYKVGNSPKHWTTILNNDGDLRRAYVFEGFFDFLSYLSYTGHQSVPRDCYVLNSLVFSPFVKKDLDEYDIVSLYLDNDSAGDRFIEDYFSDERYVDARGLYDGFEDLNDFVIDFFNNK